MKTILIAPIVILILLTACGPKPYKRSELYAQHVPEVLKGKTWVLEDVFNKKDSTQYKMVEKSCPILFQFEDQGKVVVRFAGLTKHGTYSTRNSMFPYILLLHEKVVYTPDNPACISAATTVALYMRGSFSFDVHNQSLILNNGSYRITLAQISS